MLAFAAQPIFAQSGITNDQSYISNVPNTTFVGNATQITNGTVSFNLLGTGGNDTFNLYGGNASAVFIATGYLNNTFNVITGNPGTATNSSTFSLISGDNSTFNIVQNNFNSSVSFSIIGGSNCVINDTSLGPVNSTIFLINVGSNSTLILNSKFTGQTTINEVDPTNVVIHARYTKVTIIQIIVPTIVPTIATTTSMATIAQTTNLRCVRWACPI